METKDYGFIVVGGGMSGVCAALAAARHGQRTALLQDRPVLGGNASSEIKMHICGADRHGGKKDARETGIIEELLLTNRINNPQHSFNMQDFVFESVVRREKNIDLYLNTRVLHAVTTDGHIHSVTAVQLTTEKEFVFTGRYFADATGDGYLGALAGAEYMYGREGKDVFGEPHAPDASDDQVMGNSLMFTAKDMGHPVPFVKPAWAYSYTEEQLANRDHMQISSGYWWIEANRADIIGEAEEIRLELLRMLFGVWDHIKNTPGHGAENYALDWIGSLPGKRESRRLLGDYVLRESDLTTGAFFEDAVAYGGWSMDMHTAGGLVALADAPTTYLSTDEVYQIPYRCLYSHNIDNLFLAGRAISASHMAFGSTRVMGTCAVVGQAVGTAAALCGERGLTPRELLPQVADLQRELLRDDCYIPGIPQSDSDDLATEAVISASSEKEDCPAANVAGGYTRSCGGNSNRWQSEGLRGEGEWVRLKWETPRKIGRVLLRFESNCSKELTITISDEIRNRQRVFPPEIVKDFDLVFYRQGREVGRITEKGNYLRFRDFRISDTVADTLELRCYETYGAEDVAVYGIGVYEAV